jgi:hypothetical protein
MSAKWTHKVVKMQRGMQGKWFAYPAAQTFSSATEAEKYAHDFAAEQRAAGVTGTKITVQTRGRKIVASYPAA